MSCLREPNAEPIPGYRLIEPLGSGGFGEAWKCEAPGGLFKAIKFVFGNLNSLDVDGARAEQELQALNRVKEVRHPFVLSMDRIEVVNGELVIVMELADRSLHDAFEENLQAGLVGIPRDLLLRYVRDAAEALDHMNEKHNLQHLDIKPRNLFLVSERVKVADFGLVKHLSGKSGLLGGVTPLYAPPETFGGHIASTSDQYSLAIVYQELLTGQRPFLGKTARQLAKQHLEDEPELRALPEGERPVIARALAKDPARRFPNCLSFVRALYNARSPSRSETLVALDRDGNRPTTMADMMEDVLLEQMAEEQADPAGPGARVPARSSSRLRDQVENSGSHQEVSHLGMTVAQPQTGALRPTILLGIGGFGRQALQELRCRLLDRFGDLDLMPLVRFLYVDTDGEAVRHSLRGDPEVAFRPSEVYHLPLQPVSHYRRRQLDQLADWLPKEKLYSMPRSLKTQGSRSLGRLAFTDNYLRLMARLRREIQTAAHPDTIYESVRHTGLALRDNIPRLYVLAGASGGASGYLADLGYALRRLAKQLNQPEVPVTAMLFCGAPDDPATPRSEQANLYATLTELNHFADSAIRFSAQYGTDGPRLVEQGAAFDQTYLLTQRHRTPEERRDMVAHLGSYLFHELTTPLGLRLDRLRGPEGRRASDPLSVHHPMPATAFRSLGTYGVWFPRGLLLRLAARTACQYLLEQWQAGEDDCPALPDADTIEETTGLSLVEAAEARVRADPELQPEALSTRIAELAGTIMRAAPSDRVTVGSHRASRPNEALHPHEPRPATGLSGGEETPRDMLAGLLLALEEQSGGDSPQAEPGVWANQALVRIQDWLGSGIQPQGNGPTVQLNAHKKSRLTKALEGATAQLAEEWDRRLQEVAAGVMEHPGRRVWAAEQFFTRLLSYCEEAIAAHAERVHATSVRTRQAQEGVEAAVQGCASGSSAWGWFGGRTRRLLRCFLDHLAAFARQCLVEDQFASVQQFFILLRGRLQERLRDLSFCRQRLRHLSLALETGDATLGEEEERSFAHGAETRPTHGTSPSPLPLLSTESFWESIRASATNRVVLPAGERDLPDAAQHFLQTLTAEHWQQLDQAFQDHVLSVRGGLQKACLAATDLARHLGGPLITQAVSCLGNHLPITDVAQVEVAVHQTEDGNLTTRIRAYHEHATPVLAALGDRRSASTGSQVGARNNGLAEHRPGSDPGKTVVTKPALLAPEGPQRPPSDQTSFLLIPASEAGKRYGELAQAQLPGLHLVNVPGQADLMFCRDQGGLSGESLERILQPCRAAYNEAATLPTMSPHSRFDIQDWSPLDP